MFSILHGRGDHVLFSPDGVMFSKLCFPNQVMGVGGGTWHAQVDLGKI